MMGFSAEVAEYAARKVDYSGIEQVIEYLTDRNEVNNLYTHEFVKMNDGQCFLCQEEANMHQIRRSVTLNNNTNEE
jgi:hypothetical protein